jgi:hypothetical protein
MQHRIRDAMAFLEPALRIHGNAPCYLVAQRLLSLLMKGIGPQLVPNRLEYPPLLGGGFRPVPVGRVRAPSLNRRGTLMNAPRRHDSLLDPQVAVCLLWSAGRPAPQFASRSVFTIHGKTLTEERNSPNAVMLWLLSHRKIPPRPEA